VNAKEKRNAARIEWNIEQAEAALRRNEAAFRPIYEARAAGEGEEADAAREALRRYTQH
jgi:hypothetical protein